jgi:hypothetical protein
MKFKVWVSKAYYMNGYIEVEADNADEAWDKAHAEIEEFDAPLDRNTMDDRIEVEDNE